MTLDEELNQAAEQLDEQSQVADGEQSEEQQAETDLDEQQQTQDQQQTAQDAITFEALKQQLADEGLDNQDFYKNAGNTEELVKGYAQWGKGLRTWATKVSQQQHYQPQASQAPATQGDSDDIINQFVKDPQGFVQNVAQQAIQNHMIQQERQRVADYVSAHPQVWAFQPQIDTFLFQNGLPLTAQNLERAHAAVMELQAKAASASIQRAKQQGELTGRNKARAYAEGAGTRNASPGGPLVSEDMSLEEMRKRIDKAFPPQE